MIEPRAGNAGSRGRKGEDDEDFFVSVDELLRKIEKWGEARDLHGADLRPQLVKLMEEMGELAGGIARDDEKRISDSLGDMLVVMAQLAACFRLRFGTHHDGLRSHLLGAWVEIRERAGRTEGGVFVKEGENS